MQDWFTLIPLGTIIGSVLFFWWLIRRESGQSKRRLSVGGLCVNCGYDLRSGHEKCPECGYLTLPHLPMTCALDGNALGNDWPESPMDLRAQDPGESPVVLYSTPSPLVADLLVQQLQARGIVAKIAEAGALTPMPWLGTGSRMNYQRVVVWSGDVELAIGVVKKLKAKSVATDEKSDEHR